MPPVDLGIGRPPSGGDFLPERVSGLPLKRVALLISVLSLVTALSISIPRTQTRSYFASVAISLIVLLGYEAILLLRDGWTRSPFLPLFIEYLAFAFAGYSTAALLLGGIATTAAYRACAAIKGAATWPLASIPLTAFFAISLFSATSVAAFVYTVFVMPMPARVSIDVRDWRWLSFQLAPSRNFEDRWLEAGGYPAPYTRAHALHLRGSAITLWIFGTPIQFRVLAPRNTGTLRICWGESLTLIDAETHARCRNLAMMHHLSLSGGISSINMHPRDTKDSDNVALYSEPHKITKITNGMTDLDGSVKRGWHLPGGPLFSVNLADLTRVDLQIIPRLDAGHASDRRTHSGVFKLQADDEVLIFTDNVRPADARSNRETAFQINLEMDGLSGRILPDKFEGSLTLHDPVAKERELFWGWFALSFFSTSGGSAQMSVGTRTSN